MSATATQFDLGPFTRKIRRLRSAIRSWLTVRGIGRVIWVLLAMFAFDMLLDRWFRMDLPQRAIVLGLMVTFVVCMTWRWLLRPLSQPVSDDGLVLEVEQRHPQLAQAVISGFQLLKGAQAGQASASPELVASAIREGLGKVEGLDFSDVLDRSAARKNWTRLMLGFAALAVLAVAITNHSFFQTWFQRNLLLGSAQWPLSTQLQMVGAENGQIVVPRGLDYRQLVVVDPASRIQLVDVDLEIDQAGNRALQRMRATGKLDGREHAFVFQSIASDCRVRAVGGDHVTDWVELKLVEPPAVDKLELAALLPPWTGRERTPLTGNGPHTLVSGSGVEIRAGVNKPLRSAELAGAGRTFPMELSAGELKTVFLTLPRRDQAQEGAVGGQYALRLTDESGLNNVRDTVFELRLRENEPPVVRARLLGISGLIVPRARVPVKYSATDDFGIAGLEFDTRWLEENTPIGQRKLPVPGFSGARDAAELVETVGVLEIEPLSLQPGQSFRFVIAARDFAEPEAGRGASREFLLRIVTPEELMSDLLRREIEQRGVFQQSYDRQLELNSLLRQTLAEAGKTGGAAADSKTELENRLLSLYRAQRTIGTGVIAVADRFDEFLVEVANNRLDEEAAAIDPERTIQSRFANEIVAPIRELDERLVSDAARGIEAARRVANDPLALAGAVDATSAVQEQILEKMRAILAAMQSSENFQEAVNRLLEIRRIEQNLRRDLERPGDKPRDLFDKSGGNG